MISPISRRSRPVRGFFLVIGSVFARPAGGQPPLSDWSAARATPGADVPHFDDPGYRGAGGAAGAWRASRNPPGLIVSGAGGSR